MALFGGLLGKSEKKLKGRKSRIDSIVNQATSGKKNVKSTKKNKKKK